MTMYSTLIPKLKTSPTEPLYVGSDPTRLAWPSADTRVAFDFETTGVEAHADDFRITGLAIAWDQGSWYLDMHNLSRDEQAQVCNNLINYQLVAHNLTFDVTCLLHLGVDIWKFNFEGCSFGLLKQLSSEDWPEQSWSLKAAQENILGWDTRGDVDLKKWMVENGLTTRDGSADLSRMSSVPVDILGRYACLDAQSCLTLFSHLEHTATSTPGGAESYAFHRTAWLVSSVLLNAERQMRGMYVPTGDIAVYYKNLLDRIKAARKAILDMPECKPHLAELHAAQIAQVKEEEPTKFTATGAVAKRWESWSKRLEETKKEVVFNVNSGPQKEWLFYDRMGYEPRKTTESGRRSTDKKVLPWLGPVGQALVAYNKLTAEKRYVKPCWLMSEEGNGIIYPIINSNGTVTHRTSGGGGSAVKHKFNLQQQPKVRAYLNCIKARPGHAIVHFDFPSLENRVLAAASRDENLLKLYGPGRPKNCGYLFLASRVPGLDVVKELYDPDNPVRLDEAKKKFKRERSVAKVAELALAYGAGAEKIQLELALAGFPMELSEVEAIVRARKALYPRVGQLELELEQEWNRNGGYIFDAFGYPHPIDGRLLKDRINRYCQTSGHRLLLALNYKIHLLRREREVPMTPWIPDYHDETMWEVPEQFVNEAVSIVEDAVDWVDKQVNISIVSFKDAVSVSYTLGEIKCED